MIYSPVQYILYVDKKIHSDQILCELNKPFEILHENCTYEHKVVWERVNDVIFTKSQVPVQVLYARVMGVLEHKQFLLLKPESVIMGKLLYD